MERKVETTCLECGYKITLDFGDVDFESALKFIDKLDQSSRECPGWHVEIGGWKKRWQLEDAVNRAYSDEEKAKCKEVVCHLRVVVDGWLRPVDYAVKLKNDHELHQFLVGYTENKQENGSHIVKVEYINFANEVIDRVEEPIQELLPFLR
jgi:hypothetical protein